MKGKINLLLGLVALSPAANADTIFTNAAKHGLTFEGLRTATRPAGGWYSAVQIGNDMTGYSAYSPQYKIADDFDVTEAGWTIDKISIYAFQFQANTAAITGGLMEIREGTVNGPVAAVGYWDDSLWTNVYRHFGPANDDRRVQKVIYEFQSNPLRPGKYWITFSLGSSIQGKLGFVPTLTQLNVANLGNCNARQYDVNAAQWLNLTNTNGSNPQDIPFEVEGNFMRGQVYTYNQDLREIVQLNTVNAIATPVCQFPVASPVLSSITYNTRNRKFYAASSTTNALYNLDLEGGLDPIGSFNLASPLIHGLEYSRALNSLVAVSSSSGGDNLYTIASLTGNATLVGDTGVGNNGFNNLGFGTATNTMYMTNTATDKLYSLAANGLATQIGNVVGPTNIQGLAYSPEAGALYAVDSQSDTLWKVSTSNGAATLIGNLPSGNYLGLVTVSDYSIKPENFILNEGQYFGGYLSSLRESDDDKFYILCDENEPNAKLNVNFGHGLNSVHTGHFYVEAGSTRDDLNMFLDVFNGNTNTYNTLTFFPVALQDALYKLDVVATSVLIGANEIRTRIRWIPQQDIEAADGWSVSVDKAEFILSL